MKRRVKKRVKTKSPKKKKALSKKPSLKLSPVPVSKRPKVLKIKPKGFGQYLAFYFSQIWRGFYFAKKKLITKTKKSAKSGIRKTAVFPIYQKKKRNKKKEKEKSLLLPLYFGWGLKVVLVKLSSDTLNLTSKIFRRWWQEAVALILLVAVTTSSFFWYQSQSTLGATYTWIQTDWSGGADTVNFPVHPTNQTGWTKYYSKDAEIIAGTELTLIQHSGSTTHTSATDFNAGTHSDTEVYGTGDDASVILDPPLPNSQEESQEDNHFQKLNFNFQEFFSDLKKDLSDLFSKIISFFLPQPVYAATVTWDGSESTDWFTAANWVGDAVPTSTDDVVIDGNYTNAPILDLASGSVTINSLSLGSSNTSVLTISNGSDTNKLIVTTNFTIGGYGTLNHSANSTTQTHRIFIDVGGDMTISSGGSINVNGKGYDEAAASAGKGCTAGPGSGGGGYGGRGGNGYGCSGGDGVYGSLTQPTDLGSAGGWTEGCWDGYGAGNGGGAVKLNVSGTLTVNGNITANGGNGLNARPTYNCDGGGGSGGSIWIQADTLTGSGTITANGGIGAGYSGTYYGGGGGGGRVAIYYTTSNYSGSITAYGGAGYGNEGGAGTIYLKDNTAGTDELIIDNNNQSGNTTPLKSGSFQFDTLTIQNLGYLDIESDATLTMAWTSYSITTGTLVNHGNLVTNSLTSLTVDTGGTISNYGTWTYPNLFTTTINGTLSLGGSYSTSTDTIIINNGGTLTHNSNTTTKTHYIELYLTTLTINSGGSINVNGKGYSAANGEGAGTSNTNNGGGGSGAGYGGTGGSSQTGQTGGSTYGSLTQPIDLGSGGGTGRHYAGGAGGGAIKLNVSGTTTINGTITANGGNGNYGGFWYNYTDICGSGGGGSGGSIYIITNTLLGSGTITANGGNSYVGSYESCSVQGGGGAGGRIAIYTKPYARANFTGTVQVNGGSGYQAGETGTTYYLNYVSSGEFISSAIDTGQNSDFTTLDFNIDKPSDTDLKFQLRSATSSEGLSSATWYGPTGTDDYYTTSGTAINSVHDDHRWIQYKAYFSTNDTTKSPRLDDITINYTYYTVGTYSLISSPYNTTDAANILAGIQWTENLATGTDIKFQLRTAPDSSGSPGTWSSWCGPDDGVPGSCTSTTYFTDPTGGETVDDILTDASNDQWIQYKVWLESSGSRTPTLSDVTLIYVVNAPPEFNPDYPTVGAGGMIASQVDAGQTKEGKVEIKYSIRDPDTDEGSNTPNYVTPTFRYSLDDGSNWSDVDLDYIEFVAPEGGQVSDVNNDGKEDNKVLKDNYLIYTAYWDAKSQGVSANYSDKAKIEVTINDNELANNTVTAVSAAFEFDTKVPEIADNSIVIDASTQYNGNPAQLSLSVTDDTVAPGERGEMMISLNSDFSGASWQTYTTSSSITLATDPDTVYVKFRDAKGNVSGIADATTPQTPSNVNIQDISIIDLEDPRLFLWWDVPELPPQGDFDRYNILRATSSSDSNFVEIGEITDYDQNNFTDTADNGLQFGVTYYYKITNQDTLGNISFRSAEVSAKTGEGGSDTLPPEFVTGPSVSDIYTTQATISWTTDELAQAIIYYGTSTATSTKSVLTFSTNQSVVLSGLSPNTEYWFSVEVIDSSENATTSSQSNFSTLSGPIISDISVPQVFNYQATIVWQTDIAANSYVYYSTSTEEPFTDSEYQPTEVTEHSVTLTGLEIGTRYYFYVVSGNARDDNEGNYYTFRTTRDTSPPEITDVLAWTTAYTAVITWETNELADSKLEYGTSSGSYSYSASSSDFTTVHVLRIEDLTEGQGYYYRIISKDINNNQTISVEKSFTPLRERDSTPPIITNVSHSDVFTSQATISWTTDELANSKVEYSTDPNFDSFTGATDSTMLEEHEVVLTGLNPNTTYYYRVESADLEENTATKADSYSFTTLSGPVISNVIVSSIANEMATIEWQTDLPASSTVVYSTTPSFDSYFVKSSDEEVNSHQLTLNGLSIATIYYFYVESGSARDNNAGNYYYFSTANDIISPTISQVASFSKTQSVLISWQTDELATSKVEYGTTTDYGQEASSSVLTKQHSLSFAGLESDTLYHYRVISTDASGNTSTSSDYTFTTLYLEVTTEDDTAPPALVAEPTVTVGDTYATIVWVTDELASSQIFYGTTLTYDQQISEDTTLTYHHAVTITSLTKETTYHYQIRSVDAADNVFLSQDYTFTTTDEPGVVQTITRTVGGGGGGGDFWPPKVSKVEVTDITENSAVISWKTGEKGSSLVAYGLTSSYNLLAGDDEEKVKDHRVTLTDLSPGTTYHFQAVSYDASGNRGHSEDQTFTTSGTALSQEVGEGMSEEEKRNIEILKESISQLSEEVFTGMVSEIAQKIVSPPIIAGGSPNVSVGQTTAKISWITDKKASTLVAYATEDEYDPTKDEPYSNMISGYPEEMVTFHEVEITGLEPNTTYYYQIRSKPLVGPITKSENKIFRTQSLKLEISDITFRPITENEVAILWKTNLPSATKIEYTNLRTGEKKELEDVSYLRDHTISLKNLEANIDYSFFILSRDEEGNEAISPTMTFSTGEDTTPPEISQVRTSSAITPRGDAVQTIITWKTNEFSASRVYYLEGATWREELVKSTPLDKTLTLRHTVIVPALMPGKVYIFRVESIDSSGNVAVSKDYTLLTPQRKRTIIQIMISQFEQVFGWVKRLGI
ncbi:MAG: hypothetical protein DRJ47_09565 [Thermoprotei archaeon]|nr:MAG: hypothetical protein DRJ47_09565 [Thermoprotei archaeon]